MWDKLNNIYLLLAVVVAVITLIGFVKGTFRRAWAWFRQRISGSEYVYSVPRKTIVMVPRGGTRDHIWRIRHEKEHEGPEMRVHGYFKVTNISKFTILLVVAKMKRPKAFGHVSVNRVGSAGWGAYGIPAASTTDLAFNFRLAPPIRKESEDFVTDIAIVDQFGNEHWIKKVRFIYRGK